MEHGLLDQSQEENQHQAEASLVSGPLETSFQNVSRLPEHYLVNRHSISSGPLEIEEINGDIEDGDLSNPNFQAGHLDVSRSSSKPGLLDKYLLSQSSQSIDNFLTPSLGSVQSGLLEMSVTGQEPGQLSNRSSLVLSEDDMKSVTSNDMENMIVEVGNLDSSSIAHADFQTALSNRDAVIQKLSSNLHKLMQERREDGLISKKLEDEVSLIKDQLGLAIKKAASNKEFKEKYKVLTSDHENLKSELSNLNAQLIAKDRKFEELEKVLVGKDEEISSFASTKRVLIEKMQAIHEEVENNKSSEDVQIYRVKIEELESNHVKEIEEIKERHENELQELIDKYDEEQIVEFNLLDYELDKLRDEKQDLLDELESVKTENDILKQASDEASNDVLDHDKFDKIHAEYQLIKDQLKKIENLYAEELNRRESLQVDYDREKALRESLETDLVNIGSVLDDTQYQFLPGNVRESLERSVRLSIESGALSPSRRESSINIIQKFDNSLLQKLETSSRRESQYLTPSNVTQSESEYQIADMDATPTHKSSEAVDMLKADHDEVVTNLKADHEKEMSELRKYFENVCQELEMKYRAETEETIPARTTGVATPGCWTISGPMSLDLNTNNAPVSLELGSSHVEFEFESMSPRSGFSSDNQQLSFSSAPGGGGGYHHSRNNSGLVSDGDNQPGHGRRQLEDEIINLNKKVGKLEQTLEEMTRSHAKEVEEITRGKVKEVEDSKEALRKELESEHLVKFSQVSKQIQSLQQTELDKLKIDLEEKHNKDISEVTETYLQKIKLLEKQLLDVQESQKLELAEVGSIRKTLTKTEMKTENKQLIEITPDIYEAMKADLDKLEEEKYNLRSMQILMKDLMRDLAKHYDLSEKQVKFLSDSMFLESFSLSLQATKSQFTTPVNTPFKYFQKKDIIRDIQNENTSINASELTENIRNIHLDNSEQSQNAIQEIILKVKESNHNLEDLQNKLETFVTVSSESANVSVAEEAAETESAEVNLNSTEFIGVEAGRLEVEKARLEVELGEALHRIQELEASFNSNRQSLPRSDVLSGHGEAGDVPSLGLEVGEEIRDKAARLLASYREDDGGHEVSVEDVMSVMGDLLVFSDNVSLRVRERVEEVEQQLEVADKQLRSTRQFLEEQAVEREQEREEWDRKMMLATQSRRSSKTLSRGDSLEEDGNDATDDEDGGERGQSRVAHLESELGTAVDKIYELRDIIRGLEAKLETKTASEGQQNDVVRDLKLGLEEAILSQQLVTQELELLRSSTNDQELVDHIRTLEEQLRSKSAELTKHRAAANHIQDIRAQLRAMEERVEQSTRELEHSTAAPHHLGSSCSSRSSTPAPSSSKDVQLLGSCEDIGGSVSGMEIEELARLEKKIKHLEKAETAAVEKVKLLEKEKDNLESDIQNLKDKLLDTEGNLEGLKSELEVYENKVKEHSLNEVKFKNTIKSLETDKEKLEDVDAERAILQETVTQQQMQISSLQATLQTNRHKLGSGKEEALTKLMEEKETMKNDMEKLRAGNRRLELENTSTQAKLKEAKDKLIEIENVSEAPATACDNCDRVTKDNHELKEVTEKLQSQLSVARAAQLAAQKTELPLLSQKLLDEKNFEIEQLRNHLSSISSINIKHSTPNYQPKSWLSKLDDTSGSVENLRDATVLMRDKATDLSLEQMSNIRGNNTAKILQGSAQKLQPIQETAISDMTTMTSNKTCVQMTNVNNTDNMTHVAENVTKPKVDLTEDCGEDGKDIEVLEEALDRKVAEIEYMSQLLSEKDELIDNLQDNIEDVQAQLEEQKKVEEANREALDRAREDEDKLVEITNQLIEAQNKIEVLEKNNLAHADQTLVEELKLLREENQDRIKGMENLHGIIENSQKNLDEKKQEILVLHNQIEESNNNLQEFKACKKSLENISEQLQLKENLITNLEEELLNARDQLKSSQGSDNLHIESQKILEDKQMLEKQLEKVTLEMASVQNVVSEMTKSFKHQIQLKDQEVKQCLEQNLSLKNLNTDLERKCQELEDINKANKDKIEEIEKKVVVSAAQIKSDVDNENIEHGSLDDLSNLVQAELDLSSELDNTLLSQVVSGLGLDNSTISSNSTGVSEIQRLIKKIQADGIKVLSLSERLFLMQHANVARNFNLTSASDSDTGSSKERELERKLEVLEFQLKQEKFLTEDLRKSLSNEKKNVLENLTKIGQERRSRSELETQLTHLEHELEIIREKLQQSEYKLSLRENQLHFNSDSENEEFLNTIEAQKLQILTLEESLKLEKENFSQLQHVLEVERGRGGRDGVQKHQSGAVQQQRIVQMYQELEKERDIRKSIESSVITDDVGKMIIKQLQKDLQYERDKSSQLDSVITKEKQRYNDLYVEYEFLKNSSPNVSSGVHYKFASNSDSEKYLREKNFELERYNSELELRIENCERDSNRLRAEVASLEVELKDERAKNVAGMSKDQLSRMQQVNKFLEHNLKENGEMLSSLAKLYEEGRVMKQRNSELEDQLTKCVCRIGSSSQSSSSNPDVKTMLGKYLRADSYRKALVWQKRYLLVLLAGDNSCQEPVFQVTKDYSLGRLAKFRSLVHGVIAVIRMRFLVKRWRTGKRAGAYKPSNTPTTPRALSEAPVTARSSGGVPSLDLSSCQSPVPVSLTSPSIPRSMKSMSVPNYPQFQPINPPHPKPSSLSSPRQPPTFARSNSFKSPLPRVPQNISNDNHSLGSSTSSQSRHPFTGNTPPTRDVKVRRSRSSASQHVAGVSEVPVRRSLESKMTGSKTNTTLAAVGDAELQKDLEEYFHRFGSIQRGRGKHQ